MTQFQIQNWTSHGSCSSLQTIIAVVEEVYKMQCGTDSRPIVIHCRSTAAITHDPYNLFLSCSDTVSRSGMFCAIATTIDCCKTESMVDIFQVVKAQRVQKPGLVLTVVSNNYTCTGTVTLIMLIINNYSFLYYHHSHHHHLYTHRSSISLCLK